MCGIFGLIIKEGNVNPLSTFKELFLLSESRGKEASGFAIVEKGEIKIFKTPFPANKLVKTKLFKDEKNSFRLRIHEPFIGIGHSRLVTNGYEHFDKNNQPVVKNGMVVIHNGIIVNQKELWNRYEEGERISELDSELIPTIIAENLKNGIDFGNAIGKFFSMIQGMTNIAILMNNHNNLILASNNGSIYYYQNLKKKLFVFASEKFILEQVLMNQNYVKDFNLIKQLNPGDLVNINLDSLNLQKLKIGQGSLALENRKQLLEIVILHEEIYTPKLYINSSLEYENHIINSEFIEEFNKRNEKIENLKRCTKCILPETFPFITFDDMGVCNYCRQYHKIGYLGKDALIKTVDKFRKKNNNTECIIPFSGGRDSSYVLHYVVKDLGLKPIAFSYDWGMLTDLARRNQSRMCGKLGIEHILVSADIRKKRENIRKNVNAWLKRPNLGTIPLFMAGDKHYFYYSKLLQKQNSIKVVIMGENQLEKTLFKSAFSGAKQEMKGYMAYNISNLNKIRMLWFYCNEFLLNPAFLNASLFDTTKAYFSYYSIKHDYLNLFSFIKWEENEILDILINQYDWETDLETRATWRIGDGTAAFYNYIYYMVAGFTENDTFRSNQIREGDLVREEALELSKIENKPRWDSIQWYCRTIGIDFNNTLNTINQIPNLF